MARSRCASALISSTRASVSLCSTSTCLLTRVTSSWYDLVTLSCSCSWMLVIVCSYDDWKPTARNCSSGTIAKPCAYRVELTARFISASTILRCVQKPRGVNSCATLVMACCANRRYDVSQRVPNVWYTFGTISRLSWYWNESESETGCPPETSTPNYQHRSELEWKIAHRE